MTARLLIEPLTPSDIDGFVDYRQDPDIARFQSWRTTFDEADARLLLAQQPDGMLPASGGWVQLAVRDRHEGILLGDVAIHTLDEPETYELGVTLAVKAQGRGIATEALRRILDLLFFDFNAHRVVAFCDMRNVRVTSLLRRLGMRQESRLLEAEYLKGEWTTVDGYALLAGEYTPSTSAWADRTRAIG